MSPFTLRWGSVLGREHRLNQRNCQDALCVREVTTAEGTYLLGVVCDGCGSGNHSEVGAALLSASLVARAANLISQNVAMTNIPEALADHARTGLTAMCDTLLDSPTDNERAAFIHDHLLATILGVIIGPHQTLIYAAGDGLIVVNDQVCVRDEGNMPHYFAYNLLTEAQTGFDTWLIETATLRQMALWTDGFPPELVPHIWQPRRLQRQLNIWAKAGHFADDAAGIVVKREVDDGCDRR